MHKQTATFMATNFFLVTLVTVFMKFCIIPFKKKEQGKGRCFEYVCCGSRQPTGNNIKSALMQAF